MANAESQRSDNGRKYGGANGNRFISGQLKKLTMEFKKIKLNRIVSQYTVNNMNTPLDRYCNSFLVENKGTTILFVDQYPLYPGDPAATPPIPGQSINYSLNRGEIYDPAYINLQFIPGGTNLAVVTQIVYNECQ